MTIFMYVPFSTYKKNRPKAGIEIQNEKPVLFPDKQNTQVNFAKIDYKKMLQSAKYKNFIRANIIIICIAFFISISAVGL
jgi:hypothetical protein